jgi:hypothetical protein
MSDSGSNTVENISNLRSCVCETSEHSTCFAGEYYLYKTLSEQNRDIVDVRSVYTNSIKHMQLCVKHYFFSQFIYTIFDVMFYSVIMTKLDSERNVSFHAKDHD